MSKYQFSNKSFGLSDEGFHLLRNGFNYQTIAWSDVVSTQIKKGNSLKNRPLLLVLGASMVAFAIYYVLRIVLFFQSEAGGTFFIQELLIPIFPLLVGGYMLVAALKTELIIELRAKKVYKSALKGIDENDVQSLTAYLKGKSKLITQ